MERGDVGCRIFRYSFVKYESEREQEGRRDGQNNNGLGGGGLEQGYGEFSSFFTLFFLFR